ncbi:TPA: hypothetical protein NHR53_006397 [Pseudomonas aeruginosa]|uniref:hypothetical protein n=1 Tax=Pseudomonas aeruginosa TaxID=287 RepID=UPI0011129C73|nr:hypothetical protein [Pseudomonas aeruginosa]HCE7248479.1 hypothetical protein [Pseudomonas aeruginosa]HCE8129794.1 hypothetical protein [Pseudomonas aeruginosa]HCF0447923.1 hypothetical protein [Pseudomonas aeruginosa]
MKSSASGASKDREPSADEHAGMTWWNLLTVADRQKWMLAAGNTGVVANAWAAFKHSQGEGP